MNHIARFGVVGFIALFDETGGIGNGSDIIGARGEPPGNPHAGLGQAADPGRQARDGAAAEGLIAGRDRRILGEVEPHGEAPGCSRPLVARTLVLTVIVEPRAAFVGLLTVGITRSGRGTSCMVILIALLVFIVGL